jgi:hypothetical protein
MKQIKQNTAVLKYVQSVVVAVFLGAGLMLALSGCSKMTFAPTTPSVASVTSAAACNPGTQTAELPTKIMFIVDQSGSNVNGPNDASGTATDPLKSFRSGVVSTFFNAHASDLNLQWSFVAFNDSSAVSLMPSSYFSSSSDFAAALQSFATRPDQNATPYKAAISGAHAQIQQDLLTAPNNQNYLIEFITDGYPTDYCAGSTVQANCPGQIMDSQIQSDISSLVALAPGRIQFSTVYYGPTDTSAQTRLMNMAAAGGGQFINANVTKQVNLNNTLTIPTGNCD